MAKALLMSGGVGGVSSDDVTARRKHVLQGYTALTSDSNDEPVQGTMVNRGNGMDTVEFVDAYWESKFVARMEEGFYSQVDQWKPYVTIPYAVLANVIHLDANKMLDTLQVSGVRGTIPVRGYRGPDCTEMFMYQPDGGYVVRIEPGYYHKDGSGQWKPHVVVSPALAKSAVNYHPEKTLSDTRTCEEQGQIKMVNTQDSNYRINKSASFGIDSWTNPSNPVFYVDFPHGNAYYTRPDGHPHVCIDAINLGDVTADKVMRGFTATSKNGVKFAGTMPDLQSGRVVFNGATFDGTLLSGVANKDFHIGRDYYPLKISDGYGYTGIYGGGINLALSTSAPSIRGRRIGCVMSQSVNLAPFNRIAIYWKFNGTIKNRAYFNFKAFVALASSVQRGIFHSGSSTIDGFSIYRKEIFMTDQTQVSYIDVSDINEHAFLGFHAYADVDNQDRDSLYGSLQITKIEFFN